jgi:di/tricarboxylate transporter
MRIFAILAIVVVIAFAAAPVPEAHAGCSGVSSTGALHARRGQVFQRVHAIFHRGR